LDKELRTCGRKNTSMLPADIIFLEQENVLHHGNEEAEGFPVPRFRGHEAVVLRGEDGGESLLLDVGGPQEPALR
jgi:hypothetical protein